MKCSCDCKWVVCRRGSSLYQHVWLPVVCVHVLLSKEQTWDVLQTGRRDQLISNDLSLFSITFSLSSLFMISPIALLAFSCLREVSVTTDIHVHTNQLPYSFGACVLSHNHGHFAYLVTSMVEMSLRSPWHMKQLLLHVFTLMSVTLTHLTLSYHCGKLLLKLDLCKCPTFCV